jgi:hypothetical protein
MDCSAMVVVDDFTIFSTFCVVLLVLGRPKCSSPTSDTRLALKREYHQKPLSTLRMFSKPHKALQGFR